MWPFSPPPHPNVRNWPKVLLVEDCNERATWMAKQVPGVDWDRAYSSVGARKKIMAMANQPDPPGWDAVFLDFDIDKKGGGGHKTVTDFAHYGVHYGPIVVHSANPIGGPQMVYDLRAYGFDVIYAPVAWPHAPHIWRSVVEQIRAKKWN